LKFIFFIVNISVFLLGNTLDNSFITRLEYGAMLYENPRGVGCISCHGKGNNPVVIAWYKDVDKKTKKLIKKKIVAPAINNVSFEVFLDKLRSDKTESKVMPTYFLTNEELKSLYYYINNIK